MSAAFRPRLDGQRIVITGAAGGIGRVVAGELAHRGALLSVVGRTGNALSTLVEALPAAERGSHLIAAFDTTDENQWRSRVADLCPEGGLSGLVLAAGILGPIGPAGSWAMDEFRRTIEVNLIGTLVPIIELLENLALVGGAVVTFSGGGATSPLRRYDAYAASKAAVVRLTENLADDLAARGVRINSVAPGFVLSDIHKGTLDAGPDAVGTAYFEKTAAAIRDNNGDSPELAAELVAFLLSERAGGITGRLISARWDPWRDELFQSRLRSDPDLATLRRIDDQFFTAVPRV